MTASISAAQLEQFRRNAKRLSRDLSLPHSEALDRVAAQHGFKNWSLLAKYSVTTPGTAPACPVAPPLAAPAEPAQPTDPRRRYYIHGDQFEEDPSRYYCAQCDVFFDAAHFTSHGPHTGERTLHSLERWNKRDWKTKLNIRRPDDSVNILEVPALATRAEYQALRPAFSNWLLAQRKHTRDGERRDEVGLMALGLLTSRGLPKTPKSLPLLRDHYQRHGAQYFELEALEMAWGEFIAQASMRS